MKPNGILLARFGLIVRPPTSLARDPSGPNGQIYGPHRPDRFCRRVEREGVGDISGVDRSHFLSATKNMGWKDTYLTCKFLFRGTRI